MRPLTFFAHAKPLISKAPFRLRALSRTLKVSQSRLLAVRLKAGTLPKGITSASAGAQRHEARAGIDVKARDRISRGDAAVQARTSQREWQVEHHLKKELERQELPAGLREPQGSIPIMLGHGGPGIALAQSKGAAVVESSSSASMMELVEKIEAFSRSQRPALALTLKGLHAGRMELERIAPGHVAVRLQGGSRGALQKADEQSLRVALSARGVKLTGLERVT